MSFPKVGMAFEDCRKRAKRINEQLKSEKKGNKPMQARLVDSLLNQAKLHQGEGARKELQRELHHKRKHF